MKDEKTLDDFGLKIEYQDIKVGETYPLFGAITKLIKDEPDNFVVELNNNIELTLVIESSETRDIIKSRAFETGIFMSEISEIEPAIRAICRVVIFGRKQTGTMQ